MKSSFPSLYRELSKLHEEVLRDPLSEILAELEGRDSIKGEFVLPSLHLGANSFDSFGTSGPSEPADPAGTAPTSGTTPLEPAESAQTTGMESSEPPGPA